ncbi:MAG: hypothetical protein U1F77_19970 [Kiritimatiellia bacterium]
MMRILPLLTSLLLLPALVEAQIPASAANVRITEVFAIRTTSPPRNKPRPRLSTVPDGFEFIEINLTPNPVSLLELLHHGRHHHHRLPRDGPGGPADPRSSSRAAAFQLRYGTGPAHSCTTTPGRLSDARHEPLALLAANASVIQGFTYNDGARGGRGRRSWGRPSRPSTSAATAIPPTGAAARSTAVRRARVGTGPLTSVVINEVLCRLPTRR